jgi:predicted MPP superfamily phosphohydrolase
MRLSKESRALFRAKRRFSWASIGIAALLLVLLLSYVIYDNSLISTEFLSISMPTLPKSMEGYSILHLSDIHERNLGEGGKALNPLLGGKRPNIAVISGGLVDANGHGEGFLQALQYLHSLGVSSYFVLGESDPPYMDFQPDGSYAVNPLYLSAQVLGGVYLDSPLRLYEGDPSLWLVPASSLSLDAKSAIDSLNALEESYRGSEALVRASGHTLEALLANVGSKLETAQRFLDRQELRKPTDLNILVSHIPALSEDMQSQSSSQIFAEGDLILSGHNHGPQYRLILPLWVGNEQFGRGGWFPGETFMRGFTTASGQPQYINPGLGTGRPFPQNYRLFSTPGIAMIQLTRSVAS